MKVEFYYSSKHAPGAQFPCDNAKARDLCQQLQKKGTSVKVQDCGEQPAGFMTYNAAVTGPPSAKRAVFGAKGAGERYPTEAFPRSDRELNRVVGVEEALKNLLSNP